MGGRHSDSILDLTESNIGGIEIQYSMPAETNHPVFEAPTDPSIKIWRYMDFTKFVVLLDSEALFFSRADLLGDPYEGSTSHFNKLTRPVVYKDKIPMEALQKMSAHSAWVRQWTYISCWHMNEHESTAMWKLYAQTSEAVAIQTTYKQLAALLPEDAYIGKVKYIDYQTEWLPEGNLFYPYVHKRKSFEHEREIRALVMDIPDKSEKRRSRPNPDFGRLIHIDLAQLIENVYVAPTCPLWFRSIVDNVLKKYGLSKTVATSAIDLPPTY